MRKIIVKASTVIALYLFNTSALADPAIFGLELGATTEAQMKSMYRATQTGANKFSKGSMYSIPASAVDFDGLKGITVIFDTDGVLLAVLTTLPKSKFDYINGILGGKYKRISQNIPFVGNKSAKYRDGGTEISLDAPHMSFDMSMNYVRDDLLRAFIQQSEAESRQKQQGEASKL